MKLSEEDRKLFFKLWLPLLEYVNKKYKIRPKMGKIEPESDTGYDSKDVRAVADKLWSDLSIMDEYLSKTNISPENKEIILSWKKFKRDDFIIDRHLRKGSIFLSKEYRKVYCVCGITDSLKDMLSPLPLPILADAVLIPFKDVIITDGIISPHISITFDKNITDLFKNVYYEAKRNGEIVYSL